MAGTNSNETFSPLLELPRELRDLIYREVLVGEEKTVALIDCAGKAQAEPSLLRTCQQIREEAKNVYYVNNTFTLPLRPYQDELLLGKMLAWAEGWPTRVFALVPNLVFLDCDNNCAGDVRTTYKQRIRFWINLLLLCTGKGVVVDGWIWKGPSWFEVQETPFMSNYPPKKARSVIEASLCGESSRLMHMYD